MSIGTKIDLMSKGLKEKAQNEDWWDGKTTFNWTEVIGEANQLPTTKLATPKERYNSGQNLLKAFTKNGKLKHFEIHSRISGFLKYLSHSEMHKGKRRGP